MPIAGILFDKDGTFVDFALTWGPAAYAAMRRFACGDPKLLAAQAAAMHFDLGALRFAPSSPFIAGSSADYSPAWAQALGRGDVERLRRELDAITDAESLAALTPIGEPAITMARLRREGYRLGVATNDSAASARRQVAVLELAAHVEFIAGYDSGHGGKPAPDMILAFARHIGALPADIVMVGDSVHDMRAARAAGAIAVAVLTGPAGADELAPHADALLADIAALPEWLARRG